MSKQNISITTESWMLEYARQEVEYLLGKKVKLRKESLQIETDDLVLDTLDLIYYAKTIQRIELEGKDLVGFDLTTREHIHNQEHELPTLVIQYCLQLLEIEKGSSILDPLAGVGEVIIETALTLGLHPLHVKKRFSLPLTEYSQQLPLPQKKIQAVKLTAVNQDNKQFKFLKENIAQTSLKIKCSQFDLEWLDVKFQKDQFDYMVTFLEDMEFQDQLLYQAQHIIKKKIGIISEGLLDKSIVKKNKLRVQQEKHVEEFYITILTL